LEVPALRGADEHLDEVVVHAVVEVALKGPGELAVLDIAGVDRGVVGVQAEGGVLHSDDELDCAVMVARGEVEEGVIVAAGLGEDLFEGRHGPMLA
jgi:hypothetical protein